MLDESGEARNHETEVEALAREIRGAHIARYRTLQRWADRLDAVRCAQGRDTDAPGPAYTASDAERLRELAARSPQGEDHEAGIEAALDDFLPRYVHRWEYIPNQADHRRYWRAEFERLVPFLSRCPSPERLGELLDGETK